MHGLSRTLLQEQLSKAGEWNRFSYAWAERCSNYKLHLAEYS